MTSVPLPTFVPQDAWYALTTGNTQPSIADSVPNYSFLSPVNGQDGLVGSLDGGLVYVAGSLTELDGGQQWLMWSATSTALANGSTVFNPYVVTGTPGRWLTTQIAAQTASQIVTSGSSVFVAPSFDGVINVAVNKTVGSATTLILPAAPLDQQEIRVFDAKGDAGTNPITITYNSSTLAVIAVNGGSLRLVWFAGLSAWLV